MKNIKIKLIMPVLGEFDHGLMEYLNGIKEPGTELTLVKVKGGVDSIESYYDASIAAPFILKEVESAGREGFDAVTIFCGTDPVLQAAKEISSVPMVGILEAAIYFACVLGRRFSLLTILPETVGSKYDKLGEMGIMERCASVIPLGIPALDLEKDPNRLMQVLTEKAKIAIERDGADTIILTCVGLFNMANPLSQRINIPVLDPTACGVKWCEMLARMKFSQSRNAYPFPREKKRIIPI